MFRVSDGRVRNPRCVVIGIPLGLIAANATEWLFHKHVLHGKKHGKDRSSFWSFHFHDHHRLARKHAMHDPDYETGLFQWNGQAKEALALVASAVIIAPLFPVAPFFTATMWYSGANYYVKHKRAHLDPAWAREHLPWHYDHHMGPNQDANWCVTKPWADIVMGTREPYVGTEREAQDEAKRRKRAAKVAQPVDLAPPIAIPA